MTLHVTDLTNDVNAGTPVHVTSTPSGGGIYRSFFKRFIDVALTVVLAPVVVPLVAVLAAIIAVTGGKPFYSQMRVGRNGEVFRIWKLRTMVENADARLVEHLENNPEALKEWTKTQKLKKDPRITSFGRVLRKTSLDELPQMLNVFNGTMSLVGPRPMMVDQKSFYPGRAYYNLRPGITGLWQISDRNECEFAERAAFDDKYNATLSAWTDLKVLNQTVGVVLRATGH